MTEPKIWMDVTTSLRFGGQANGTTRVEQCLAQTLNEALGPRLGFCRYRSEKFVSAALPEFAQRPGADTSPQVTPRGLGAKSAKANRLGRRLERAVRRSLKAVAARVRKKVGSADRFADAAAGDCLFLSGETWSPRYDFEVLRALRREKNLALVALCQDLIPITDPQFFDSVDFVKRFEDYVEFLLRNADLIFAISESTKRELDKVQRRIGSMARIEVIQLGSDFSRSPGARPSSLAHLEHSTFVLSVSTIQARKNFDLLYRIWRKMAHERGAQCPTLVIVGQRGFGSDDLLWQISHDPLVMGKIVLVHNVLDDQLAWLYRHCTFTVYPSFAEGWGLPISESLAYGKVCLASDTTSMPEASQGLCHHIDPIDAISWHQQIVALLDDPQQLKLEEDRVRQQFRPRYWRQTADEVSKLLIEASASHGPR